MKQQPHSLGSRVVLGAFAGITGAGCMDLVRFAARRAGVIQRRVPEQVARALLAKVGVRAGGKTGPGHDAAVTRDAIVERVLHFGYGATLAAGLAAFRPRASVTTGALFGIGTWLFGSGFVLPAVGARHPWWKARTPENLIDVAAHLTYGVVAAWGLRELVIHAGADKVGRPRLRTATSGPRVG